MTIVCWNASSEHEQAQTARVVKVWVVEIRRRRPNGIKSLFLIVMTPKIVH